MQWDIRHQGGQTLLFGKIHSKGSMFVGKNAPKALEWGSEAGVSEHVVAGLSQLHRNVALSRFIATLTNPNQTDTNEIATKETKYQTDFYSAEKYQYLTNI